MASSPSSPSSPSSSSPSSAGNTNSTSNNQIKSEFLVENRAKIFNSFSNIFTWDILSCQFPYLKCYNNFTFDYDKTEFIQEERDLIILEGIFSCQFIFETGSSRYHTMFNISSGGKQLTFEEFIEELLMNFDGEKIFYCVSGNCKPKNVSFESNLYKILRKHSRFVNTTIQIDDKIRNVEVLFSDDQVR